MFQSYFKIAWRSLVKNRFYTVINLLSLLAGILFTLLIGMYVWGEGQVNRQLRHADRQYILFSHWKDPNMGLDITTLAPLAKQLHDQYPALVANYYRWDGLTSIVSRGDKHLRESIQLGDPTLLSMYGFTVLHGDPQTALQRPFSVVLTADRALKYFGKTDVVGQTLNIQSFAGDNKVFTVTAVLENLPENSVTQLNADLKSGLFVPTNTFAYFGRTDFDSWRNTVLPSYIELQEGVSPDQLTKPIQQLIAQNTDGIVQKNLRVEPVALTDFYRQKDNGLVKRMTQTLAWVGLFILLMAVINFINLATSRAHSRIGEISIRKMLGSARRQLLAQFLLESLMLTGIATVLAIGCYFPLKPLFEQVIGKPLVPIGALPIYAISTPILLIISIGLLTGLYPALVLSSLPMIQAIKGKFGKVRDTIWLRQALVGVQFCVAAVVLVGAIVVSGQVRYLFGQRLGYNKEFVVSAQVPRDWTPAGVQKMEAVRRVFATMPQVTQVSLSHEIPNGNNGVQPIVYKNGTDSTQGASMQALVSDENYLNTYGIGLAAGRFFEGRDSDSLTVVLNEKAVRVLGYSSPTDAIGKQLRATGDNRLFTVRGVSRDFHFGSMQQAIQPMLFFSVKAITIYRYLSFKVKPGAVQEHIAAIEQQWARLLPGSSFEYTFMDETLRNLYRTEVQLQQAAYLSTALAILMVVLSVIGLVSLSVARRTKEVGVRKVLGASVGSLVGLFLKEYAWIVLIANALAYPFAYWLLTSWLANYASHAPLGWESFIQAALILIALTGAVVSYQAIKAALADPVKSLRSE
ncbi:MAG: FtsX-like permease family protein [Cytophagales bacterium]|nr:MAG: FtsX-like permease family protein [Cytophagales bacterium]